MRTKVGFLGRRKDLEAAMWCTENSTLPVGSMKTVANIYRTEHKSHYFGRQQKCILRGEPHLHEARFYLN